MEHHCKVTLLGKPKNLLFKGTPNMGEGRATIVVKMYILQKELLCLLNFSSSQSPALKEFELKAQSFGASILTLHISNKKLCVCFVSG